MVKCFYDLEDGKSGFDPAMYGFDLSTFADPMVQ